MALQFSITAIGTILVQAALVLVGFDVVASYSRPQGGHLVIQPFAAIGCDYGNSRRAQDRGTNDLQPDP